MSALIRAALLPAPTLTARTNAQDTTQVDWSITPVVGASSYVIAEDGATISSGTSGSRTGRTRGQSYTYSAASIDPSGRVGPSTSVTVSIPAAVVSGRSWHPGHYMQVMFGQRGQSNQGTRLAMYDAIANEDSIVGVCLPLTWADMESSAGNYSSISGWIRTEYDYLEAMGKSLFIRFFSLNYASTSGSLWPSYLANAPYNGGYTTTSASGTTSVITRIWDDNVRARFNLLMTALAAELDGQPYFEGLYLNRETAPGSGTGGGYTNSGYVAGLRDIAAHAASVFVNSNVCVSTNFLVNQATVDSFIAYLRTQSVGVGGPDVVPRATFTNAYQTITGATGTDYRGVIPLMFSVETSEIEGGTGALGSYTMDQLRDFGNDTLQASHLFWHRQSNWSSVMLPYLRQTANALTNTAQPSVYTA